MGPHRTTHSSRYTIGEAVRFNPTGISGPRRKIGPDQAVTDQPGSGRIRSGPLGPVAQRDLLGPVAARIHRAPPAASGPRAVAEQRAAIRGGAVAHPADEV